MTKQKKGFWLFIASLIPGAGELYMGFRKQGLSIMLIFYSILALGAATGMDWLIFFLPIVWIYSFFNTHNLKSLSEEEFYSVEDDYVLRLDEFFGSANQFISKYRSAAAVLLIMFGFSILLNSFIDTVYWLLPTFLANALTSFSYSLPQAVIAIAIIVSGFHILSQKKAQAREAEMRESQEHYWGPYRPYQQSTSDTDIPFQENVYQEAAQPVQNQPFIQPDACKDTPAQNIETPENPL